MARRFVPVPALAVPRSVQESSTSPGDHCNWYKPLVEAAQDNSTCVVSLKPVRIVSGTVELLRFELMQIRAQEKVAAFIVEAGIPLAGSGGTLVRAGIPA